MCPCTQPRWRLVLFCVALTTLSGCASAPRPVASAEAAAPGVAASSTAVDAPPPVEAGFYRVNAGDTLERIAKSFGRTPALVARWNKMPVSGPVSVGQVLRVAPPVGAEPKLAAGTASRPAASVKPGQASAPSEAARFKWPVPGPVNVKFAAGRSKGIELGGRAGEPVKAAESGKVVYVGARVKAYGRLIVIKHDGHLVTAYGNNRRLLVTEGAVVTQGQAIAEMGTDTGGNATLKFEVRKDGKPVDPLTYLPKRSG